MHVEHHMWYVICDTYIWNYKDTSYNNHLDVVVYESVCMPLVIHVNWVVIGRWLIRHPLLSKKFARRGQKKWENRKTKKTRKPRKLRNRDIPEVRKQKMLALWRRVNFEGFGLGWGCVDARRMSYVVDASNVFFGTFPKMRHPRKQILAFTTTSWIMRLPLKRKHDILYAFSKMQQIPRFHLKSITFHRTQNQMPTLLFCPNWTNRSFPGTRKGFQRIGNMTPTQTMRNKSNLMGCTLQHEDDGNHWQSQLLKAIVVAIAWGLLPKEMRAPPPQWGTQHEATTVGRGSFYMLLFLPFFKP
jgi:hypothetical protein